MEESKISREKLAAEIRRAEQLSEIKSNVKHIGSDMTDLKDSNKELLKSVTGLTEKLAVIPAISKRVDILETKLLPLHNDFQVREGKRNWLNDLGLQAPMWVLVIGVAGAALLYWFNKNTSGVVAG